MLFEGALTVFQRLDKKHFEKEALSRLALLSPEDLHEELASL